MTTTALERFQALLRVDTVSHSDETKTDWSRFHVFVELLEQLYPALHAALDREIVAGHSVLWHWKGAESGDPSVLMAHYDVVSVTPEDWSSAPFAADTVLRPDGRTAIIGRGAVDDKGSLVTLLEAVEAAVVRGERPQRDVYLVSTHNEETAGDGAPRSSPCSPPAGSARASSWTRAGTCGAASCPASRPDRRRRRDRARHHEPRAHLPRRRRARLRSPAPAGDARDAAPRPRDPPAHREPVPLDAARADRRAGQGRRPARRRGARRLVRAPPRAPGRGHRRSRRALEPLRRDAAHHRRRHPAARQHRSERARLDRQRRRERAHQPRRHRRGSRGADPRRHRRPRGRDLGAGRARALPVSPTGEPGDGGPYDVLHGVVREVFPEAIVAPYVQTGGSDARHFHAISDGVYRFIPFEISPQQQLGIHGADESIEVDQFERAIVFYATLLTRL
ncbi:M20/M25/M40 family metallo-hydrolase [Rathayibacter oskolensis]|nr:M20/M25/M40 family metallo-hydrolase [Rathayibacter oskolensis]WKK71642.1 M20/M25/M40 family metallo-hydrolase [Rathayibacter oskolensis]